jgi:dihydrofolate reductase
MGQIKSDITMSLDGFIAGPNDGAKYPLGEGGGRLHDWLYGLASFREMHGDTGGETNTDSQILGEAFASNGAFLMGRRMFDIGEELWGPNPPFHRPVFVVTHIFRQPLVKEGGTTFTFITDSLEGAVEQSKASAGDKDVLVTGGANLVQQLLAKGLLDEIQIHIAPVLFGEGRSLFAKQNGRIELEATRVVESPNVTHIRYGVVK